MDRADLTVQTAIPIPAVHWYATDQENEIGYPWILMDYVAGTTMQDKWVDMTHGQKERIMKQLAFCQSELLSRPFESIGSLYATNLSPSAHDDNTGSSIQRLSEEESSLADMLAQASISLV